MNVFRDKIHPLYKLAAIIAACVAMWFILSPSHRTHTTKSCSDIATVISISTTCPEGTYLELSESSSFSARQYVICRCSQPRQPMIVIEQPRYQEPRLDVVPKTLPFDGGASVTM